MNRSGDYTTGFGCSMLPAVRCHFADESENSGLFALQRRHAFECTARS